MYIQSNIIHVTKLFKIDFLIPYRSQQCRGIFQGGVILDPRDMNRKHMFPPTEIMKQGLYKLGKSLFKKTSKKSK